MIIHLRVGKLLPAVAKNHKATMATQHQVKLNVAVPKDIKIVVIAYLFLFFSK